MTLDLQIAAFLEQFNSQKTGNPIFTMPPSEARKAMSSMLPLMVDPNGIEPVGEFSDFAIQSHGEPIRVRLYKPTGEGPHPALIFYHGGGWVIGSLDSSDRVCRMLCSYTQCIVVSVDYRLAPEHKFPTGLEDCYNAVQWFYEHATEYGIDQNRIAVGGESSGGNLAAAVCILAMERESTSIIYQLLITPVTDLAFATESFREYAEGYFLTREAMEVFKDYYINSEEDIVDPLASPLCIENPSKLPPGFVITAEYDPLRDEAEIYAQKLRDNGVSMPCRRYQGAIHGFTTIAQFDIGRQALKDMADLLRVVFAEDKIMSKPFGKQYDKQYIAGAWKYGSSGNKYHDLNPFNLEIIATFVRGTKADVDEAYSAAQNAQKSWAHAPAAEKQQVLIRAAEILERRITEFQEIIIKETGSSAMKAYVEVLGSADLIRNAATYPELMAEPTVTSSTIPDKENLVYRIPTGVVGVISPFNFPLYLSMRSVAPAIATGNAVVLKPDIQTAISGGLLIADVFAEAGLPKGVLNVLTLDVADIGDYFVEHPIPRTISFTGSTAVGRRIGAIAGQNLKRAVLELGGNSPIVVLADADLEQAVHAAIFGKFIHQGQICMSTNRILVHRSIYEKFIARFIERVQQIPCGDPASDPSVIIGPIINEKQIQKILGIIEEGKKEGRLVLEGNKIGNVLTPYVFVDVNNTSKLAQAEIFGPVAVIIPFDTDEEGLAFANDTPYGLSSSVFTSDLDRGITWARRMETGMSHVNDSTVNEESSMPFGGEKMSGLGRFGGKWAFEEFTRLKWVSVQREPRDYPF